MENYGSTSFAVRVNMETGAFIVAPLLSDFVVCLTFKLHESINKRLIGVFVTSLSRYSWNWLVVKLIKSWHKKFLNVIIASVFLKKWSNQMTKPMHNNPPVNENWRAVNGM